MDRDAVNTALGRFVEMTGGALTLGALAVADRCGLLATMAGHDPATSDALAADADLDERYVREILATITAGGVVDYDAGAQTYHLSNEQAAVLADERSPYLMAGWLDFLPTVMGHAPAVATAARNGGGVAFGEFGPDLVRGIDRGNGPSMRILLTRRWLPAVPGLTERLERGSLVADVGCGSGTAAMTMAKAYPASTFIGYDVDTASIRIAEQRTADAGLTNLSFEAVRPEGMPDGGPFDLVTAFDVVHDMTQPVEVLRSIRGRLAHDGIVLIMEPRMAANLEDNISPRGAMIYGISLLLCMTQTLAEGGAGLGAAWGPEQARSVAQRAGFTGFEEIAVDNPFSAFYVLDNR